MPVFGSGIIALELANDQSASQNGIIAAPPNCLGQWGFAAGCRIFNLDQSRKSQTS